MNNKQIIFALGAIVGAGVLWATAAVAGGGRVSLTDLEQALTDLNNERYVPFKTQISGGICNTAAVPSANPEIRIDSDGGSGTFTVTSIHARTNGISAASNYRLTLNSIVVDGTSYEFKTNTLVADSLGGSAIDEAFGILGADIRSNSTFVPEDTLSAAGRVPHELVANSSGSNDIIVRLFCRSDVDNAILSTISVNGWKRAADTVTVSYIPGN